MKPTRNKKMMGVNMPPDVWLAVRKWVASAPERTISMFVREAVREKLRREHIPLKEAA